MIEATDSAVAPATRGPRPAADRKVIVAAMGRGLALVLLLLIFSTLAPGFLSRSNWLNTSVYATTTLLLGLGETLVVITAGIDLSVGATLGVSSSLAAVFLSHAGAGIAPVLGAIALGLLSGAAIGVLNGLLIAVVGVTPFVATLGTLGIGTGITLLLTNGTDVTIPSTIAPLGNSVWFGWLPVPVVITAGAAMFVAYVLKCTRFGTYTYATGSSPNAARRAGVNVTRHLLAVYTLSGLIAGVAGILTLARFSVGSPTAGQDAELDAIAAVVIGGASLFGGSGGVGGTVIGSLFVSIMVTGLVLLGVVPYWQTIAIGLLIVGAVGVQEVIVGDRWERRRRRLREVVTTRQRRIRGGRL